MRPNPQEETLNGKLYFLCCVVRTERKTMICKTCVAQNKILLKNPSSYMTFINGSQKLYTKGICCHKKEIKEAKPE